MNYDVAIVGAGPAGSVTALHLCHAGHKVLLIDKSKFPRHKACGDALGFRGAQYLRKIDGEFPLDGCFQIHGLRLIDHVSGRKSIITKYESGHGLVVRRWDLDHRLLDLALSAGADVRLETRAVDLITQESDPRVEGIVLANGNASEILSAKVVVLADGGAGKLSRSLFSEMEVTDNTGFAVRQYVEGVDSIEAFLDFYPLDPDFLGSRVLAYGWAFPVCRGVANVGMGFVNIDEQPDSHSLKQYFRRFLDTLQESEARYANVTVSGKLVGAPIRMSPRLGNCSYGNALLVGEAAGLVNSFTGEGIVYAFESAELAAQLISRQLNVGEIDFSEYGDILADRFGQICTDPDHVKKIYGSIVRQWSPSLTRFVLSESTGPVDSSIRQIILDNEPATTADQMLQELDKLTSTRQIRDLSVELIDKRLRKTDPLFAYVARHVGAQRDGADTFVLAIVLVVASRKNGSVRMLAKIVAAVQLCLLTAECARAVTVIERGSKLEFAMPILTADLMLCELMGIITELPTNCRPILATAVRSYLSSLRCDVASSYGGNAGSRACLVTAAVKACDSLDDSVDLVDSTEVYRFVRLLLEKHSQSVPFADGEYAQPSLSALRKLVSSNVLNGDRVIKRG